MENSPQSSYQIVYLTSDLMFWPRVKSAAQSMGVETSVVGSRKLVCEQVANSNVDLVLIDLDHPDANVAALVDELSRCDRRPKLIAYGPHVKEPLLAAAQAAGCDLVLSRGEFHSQFAHSMLSWIKGPNPGSR